MAHTEAAGPRLTAGGSSGSTARPREGPEAAQTLWGRERGDGGRMPGETVGEAPGNPAPPQGRGAARLAYADPGVRTLLPLGSPEGEPQWGGAYTLGSPGRGRGLIGCGGTLRRC